MFHLNLELVGEIEHSIALVGRETAIYAQRLHPEKPNHFVHEQIAGGIAVFTGVGSPLTQAIGVGLNGPVSEEEFAKLEAFFFERGCGCARAEPFHPPYADGVARLDGAGRGDRTLDIRCHRPAFYH